MRGKIILIALLAALVFVFTMVGYLSGEKRGGEGSVTLIIRSIGSTTTESFGAAGMTVMDLLGENHSVEKTAGGFIKCIDSVCANKEFSWLYYIDGKEVPLGAASYMLDGGETIKFEFGRIK